MLTALLFALVLVLTLACAWQFVAGLAAGDRAALPWRIALDYIADEQCDLPHEFAACFIAGNREAIDRKFPGFHAWADRRRIELEAEYE